MKACHYCQVNRIIRAENLIAPSFVAPSTSTQTLKDAHTLLDVDAIRDASDRKRA